MSDSSYLPLLDQVELGGRPPEWAGEVFNTAYQADARCANAIAAKTEIVALEIILIASAPLLPAQPDTQTIVTEPHFDIAIRRLNDAQHRAEMGKAIFERQKVTAK